MCGCGAAWRSRRSGCGCSRLPTSAAAPPPPCTARLPPRLRRWVRPEKQYDQQWNRATASHILAPIIECGSGPTSARVFRQVAAAVTTLVAPRLSMTNI